MVERRPPKPYEPSPFWWLAKPKYIAIFLRELSSVFIILYAVLYSLMLFQLKGAQGYRSFVQLMATPPFLVLSLVMLFFAIYHSITWFLLVPKVQPVKVAKREIRGSKALVLNLALWLLASYLVASLIFTG